MGTVVKLVKRLNLFCTTCRSANIVLESSYSGNKKRVIGWGGAT